MDDATLVILVVAAVAIVLLLVMGPRLGWFSLKLFGAGLEAKPADSPRGARIQSSKARDGDAEAIDYTGERAEVESTEAGGSIRAITGTPPDSPPKA